MNKVFALLFIICTANFAQATIPGGLCSLIREANSGVFTPTELCQAHSGNFCDGISMGQAVCIAGGESFCDNNSMATAICKIGGGSFCDDVKSDVEAVCVISSGQFCNSLEAADKLNYFSMLQACKN